MRPSRPIDINKRRGAALNDYSKEAEVKAPLLKQLKKKSHQGNPYVRPRLAGLDK
jgi:hypothetical protein